MAYYFGFKPSDKLLKMLDDVDELTGPNSSEPYYKHRDLIVHQIAHELLNTMLVNLIEVIPNPERQASMKKVVNTVENYTSTLLDFLLGKDTDKDVLPTIAFLYDDTLFIDNEGKIRLGLKFDSETATIVVHGFESVTAESVDIIKFKKGIDKMNNAALTHFVTNFAATLPLGIIKRKSVPIAKTGITKVLDIAVTRLLPKLDNAGFNRLANFYRPFIVELEE